MGIRLFGLGTGVISRARRSAFLAGVAFAAGFAQGGCSEHITACTEIGCQDQFYATVTSADGGVPAGTHVLEVTADGVAGSCTFQVPLATLPGGETVVPACTSGLRASVVQASNCTESVTAAGRTLTCVPIPGHFAEEITVVGKAAQLHVRLTVDGIVLLERTEMPTYRPSQPNGPECTPTCQQATAQWMFSAP